MNADDTDGARFHIGSTIAGRYLVERPIGEGAMGAVALARHVSLGETVAIKFLRPELRRDPVATARLAREAKALARIKSDHVARVLDVGVTLSVGPYMVMEYLEGVDLGALLETEGPLPVPRAVECVLQVCEALTVAHTAGITHRDIKPQNLFLARHGRFETLKVLDFGIAEDAPSASPGEPSSARDPFFSNEPPSSRELRSSREPGLPSEGAGPASRPRSATPVYGTPSYMAPERVRNDPDADHRSDIWSVGVVLHELVTGRAIFDADSITETCARVVSDEPLPLERNETVLPPSLRAIIARCLERDPALRYQSVEELAAALAALATMHERFRGRSTGAFSRRLVQEELALRQGPASERHSPAAAPPGSWQHVVAGLHAWGARLWASTFPRYVGLGAAGLLLAGMGVWLAGMRWMSPPPSAVPIRAEPPLNEREAIVDNLLPLAAPGTRATPEPVPMPSAEPAASPAEASGSVDEVKTLAERATTKRDEAAPRVRPTSSRRTSATPAAGAEMRASRHERAAAHAGADERNPNRAARSRVRLVDGPNALDATRNDEPLKRERSKKVRPVPAWLQPYQSKETSPEP